ncbi:unnamed protein product [Cyprideis torosa]|uniref:Protein kinase domain-containing protein n=1 Tax=Cyprideis torosa TaxID=163714 RepID=A0A7R8ZIL6_9CRUS|nr:unnamed protein product [Cyprideis torosa]CAG0886442.1 unnamed protein product [Cyprideis torosa]
MEPEQEQTSELAAVLTKPMQDLQITKNNSSKESGDTFEPDRCSALPDPDDSIWKLKSDDEDDASDGPQFDDNDERVVRLELDRLLKMKKPIVRVPGGGGEPNPNQEIAVEAMKKHGYVFDRKLGAGAYATVFLVNYTDADGKSIKLAAKVIDRKKLPQHFIKKFFPRELAVTSSMNHPHIVKVHSVIQKMEFVFIFMECAPNGDLLKFIQKNEYCSELQTLVWGSQMMSALAYLANIQICNRDIKPENFLISRNFNTKMVDFGFARKYGPKEKAETYCGSPVYCAPEIMQAIPYYPLLIDIWSMGVTFYVMVTGRLPFDYTTTESFIKHQMARAYVWEGGAAPMLSAEFKNLVSRMLEPDIKKRITLKEINSHPFFSKEMYKKLGGNPNVKGGKV